MDYEKKYKEALARATKLHSEPTGGTERIVCEQIFPELMVSEDEKIMKELIGFLRNIPNCNYTCEEMALWLEKQGEQKPQGKSALEAINEEKVDNADKVEPKIKIGDWVVKKDGGLFANGNHYVRITDIDKERYWFDSETWLEAKYIRLWNISDAKDGNVLNSPSNRLIWIYKDNEHYHACVNMNYVTDNVATDDLLSIPSDACPATKDEQTILFARMKESGYEWDAKLKQLRKIENETEIPFGAKDSELQEATYYIPKGFYAEIDDDKVVIKKGEKPTAWSEEYIADVFEKVGLAKIVREQSNDALTIALQDAMIELSKVTLQQKPAWSEDDIATISRVISIVKWAAYSDHSHPILNNEGATELIERLKSLKDRSTWEPSDEQMKELNYVVNLMGASKFPCENDYCYNVLKSLRDQLKKLK